MVLQVSCKGQVTSDALSTAEGWQVASAALSVVEWAPP